jgi:predicted metal-dependent hydrolase
MRVIRVDGVEIEVTRKAIRSLRLRICPPLATVRLSVPWRATRAAALCFVLSRRDWIRQRRERMLSLAAPAPVVPEDGARIPVWGRDRVLRLTPGRFRMELTDDELLLRLRDPPDPACCARALDRACRALLLERMTSLAAAWSPILGVAVPELRIRGMKKRWGTCYHGARRVCVNAALVRHPPECLEYVLAHELAHLLERGHTERFRAVLDRHLPDWRSRRSLLNAPFSPAPPEEPLLCPHPEES